MLQTYPARRQTRVPGRLILTVALGIGLASVMAMRVGSAAPQDAPRLSLATILPVAARAEPGAPRVSRLLGTATGAIERCDPVSGACRALPVEDALYRMSDGSAWVARTAYDDHGRVAYTLWYDGAGAMVGAPYGF